MVPASCHCPESPDRSAWLAGTSEPRERGRFARTSSLLVSSAASGTTREASSVPFSATSFRESVFSWEKIVVSGISRTKRTPSVLHDVSLPRLSLAIFSLTLPKSTCCCRCCFWVLPPWHRRVQSLLLASARPIWKSSDELCYLRSILDLDRHSKRSASGRNRTFLGIRIRIREGAYLARWTLYCQFILILLIYLY